MLATPPCTAASAKFCSTNGWMSRDGFVLFQAGMVAVMGGVFFLLPRLLARLPMRFINVPNRDYWTRPENVPELQAILGRYLGWMGVLVLGLLVTLIAVTLRVNLMPEPHLEPSWAGISLGVFLAAELLWLVLFLTRFLFHIHRFARGVQQVLHHHQFDAGHVVR